MAKKKVWGFNEAGFNRVVEATRRVLRSPTTGPSRRRRQNPIIGGGSGGVLVIRFRLVASIYCEACTAIAEVMSRPPGMAVVPEEVDGLVTVVDRVGDWLDEPSDSLIGRVGYATYLTVDPAHEIGPCPGLPFTAWEITYLQAYEECR